MTDMRPLSLGQEANIGNNALITADWPEKSKFIRQRASQSLNVIGVGHLKLESTSWVVIQQLGEESSLRTAVLIEIVSPVGHLTLQAVVFIS